MNPIGKSSNHQTFTHDARGLDNRALQVSDARNTLRIVAKWISFLPTSDKEQCDAMVEACRELYSKSDFEVQKALINLMNAVNARMLDLGDAKITSRRDKVEDSSLIAAKSTHLDAAMVTLRTPSTSNQRPPLQLFCQKRERLGGIFHWERLDLQDLIEKINLQFLFEPPMTSVKSFLSRTTYEEKQVALERLPELLTPYLELTTKFLRKCQDVASRTEGLSESPVVFWPEAARMLRAIYCDLWGDTSSRAWRQGIRQAWLSVHPDKNGQRDIFELGRDGAGVGASLFEAGDNVEINDDVQQVNARLIKIFLDLTQQLSRIDGFFEEVTGEQSRRRSLGEETARRANIVHSSLFRLQGSLEAESLDRRLNSMTRERTADWVTDAVRGAACASRYNPVTSLLGRGLIDYENARACPPFTSEAQYGMFNQLMAAADRAAGRVGALSGSVVGRFAGIIVSRSPAWESRGSQIGARVMATPFWALGSAGSVIFGVLNLAVQAAVCLLGAGLYVALGSINRTIARVV